MESGQDFFDLDGVLGGGLEESSFVGTGSVDLVVGEVAVAVAMAAEAVVLAGAVVAAAVFEACFSPFAF